MSVIVIGEPGKIERLNKGKSLLAIENDYIAIDIETTGLDTSYDEILELGAVKYSGGVEVSRFQSLVKPEYEISEFITELTGITNEMVANAPSISDVLPDFLNFISQSLLVGHNVNFDINFIYDRCEELGLSPFSNDFVDTMRLSRRLYPNWKNHKLSTMINELGIGEVVEHRALGDCIQTAKSYEALKAYAKEIDADLSIKRSSYFSAKDIVVHAGSELYNPDSPLFGKVVVFTGTLERMPRRDAMQLVVDIGGFCGDSITKQTNFLVLGNNDYCSSIKGGKSNKQKKAEKLILEGQDISIISENVFYEMMEE